MIAKSEPIARVPSGPEMQKLLANALRVGVMVVLFHEDFYALVLKPEPDLAIANLDACWQVVPQPGWMVSADDQGNMTAHATEPYEPPARWRYVATLAFVFVPDASDPRGLCRGLGFWFPMKDFSPTPLLEAFLDYVCDGMLRRIEAKAKRPAPDNKEGE